MGYRYQSRATAGQLLARVEEVGTSKVDVVTEQLRRNDVALFHGDAAFRDADTVDRHRGRRRPGNHGGQYFDCRRHRTGVGGQCEVRWGIPPQQRRRAAFEAVSPTYGCDRRRHHRRRICLRCSGLGHPCHGHRQTHQADGVSRFRNCGRTHSSNAKPPCHVPPRRGRRTRDVIDGPPRRVVLTLESGKRVVSESVLYAAGRMGATDSLNLRVAGLTAGKRGHLKVDAQFRTEVPHIFAGGRCHRASQPCVDLCLARSPCRVSCLRSGSRTDIGTLSGRHIRHPRDFDGGAAGTDDLTERRIPYETGVARYREIARDR